MFTHTSRYANVSKATHTMADGRDVIYIKRRFLPDAAAMPLLAEVAVEQSDRPDLITARTLGDPEQFWRVCDANTVMHPQELIAEPGRRVRVPLPQP